MEETLEDHISNIITYEVQETLANYNKRIEKNQNLDTIIEELNREKETYDFVKRETENIIHRIPDGVLQTLYETQLSQIITIHKVIELLKKKANEKRKRKSSSQTVEKQTNKKHRNSGSSSGSRGGMRMRKKQTVKKQLKRRKTRKHRT